MKVIAMKDMKRLVRIIKSRKLSMHLGEVGLLVAVVVHQNAVPQQCVERLQGEVHFQVVVPRHLVVPQQHGVLQAVVPYQVEVGLQVVVLLVLEVPRQVAVDLQAVVLLVLEVSLQAVVPLLGECSEVQLGEVQEAVK